MDPEYGRRYRELYERHWWWRSREAAVLNVLREHLESAAPRSILDIGCGNGLFFPALKEFGDVEGIEPSVELVSHSGPDRARIRVAPFDANFQPGKQFQLALMLDVLEHLSDPGGALRHATGLLAPGGYLLITVPAFNLLWTNHDVINHHHTRYRRNTLRPLLRAADLQIIEERYWYQWTCPVKLVVGVAEKIFRLAPSLPSVPPRWMNELLFELSRMEQKTFGAWGVTFGSSLMTLCQKRGEPAP